MSSTYDSSRVRCPACHAQIDVEVRVDLEATVTGAAISSGAAAGSGVSLHGAVGDIEAAMTKSKFVGGDVYSRIAAIALDVLKVALNRSATFADLSVCANTAADALRLEAARV